MIKQLYLLRHGQAEHTHGTPDFERNLTYLGVVQLKELGAESNAIKAGIDKVLCSSAVRTTQTAEIFFGDQIDNIDIEYKRELYEAPVRNLLKAVNQVEDQVESLLLIGHNPSISQLFEYLSGKNYCNLNPGDLVSIRFDGLKWSEITKGCGRSD